MLQVQGFKYKVRKDVYTNHNSNNEVSLTNMTAYSYKWWRYLEKIGPLVVFNNFRYSPTTAKHQHQAKSLLATAGVQIHATIEAPGGLQDLDSAIRFYESKVSDLVELINKPGTRKAKNVERKAEVKELNAKIKQVKHLKKMQEKTSS